jgi:hypothetical protein
MAPSSPGDSPGLVLGGMAPAAGDAMGAEAQHATDAAYTIARPGNRATPRPLRIHRSTGCSRMYP